MGGHTTDTLRVDETNRHNILQALPKWTLVGAQEVHAEILAVERAIRMLHLIKDRRVGDLGRRKPVEEAEIQHGPV